MDARYRPNTPKVISETIDGEVVIINLGTGTYYSLQGSAAVVWHGVEQGATVAEVEAFLSSAYPAAAGVPDAVARFIDEVVTDGLLVAADGAPPEPPVFDDPAAGEFRPPLLERFTDMQDLILLDPVHDVDTEAGWPRAKRPAQEAAGDQT